MSDKARINKRQIVQNVQNQFFNDFKKKEISRLESITKCNPNNDLTSYYQCVDGINQHYNLARKLLN